MREKYFVFICEDAGQIIAAAEITLFEIMPTAKLRTRLHKHMRTSFRQILLQTALKILAGRKPACGFLPTLQQNYARKSAHISYEDRFL